MRFDTRRTTTLATVVTVLMVVLLVMTAGPVGAKKPVKPPPPPPSPVDGGTVYCCADGFTMKMNPDGTGQTALATSLRWFAEPSIDLHGGRWFLQVDPVPNQTYPDGRPRLELFAIHESGSPVVQLTDGQIDASNFVEPNNQGYPVEDGRRGYARWTDGDTKVSYMALRTVYDSQGNRTIQVGGLYALAVSPSNLPSHVATAMSGNPLLPRPVIPTAYPCLWNPHYDWNPAGTAVVYWVPNNQPQARGFWIAQATDGFSNPVLLTASSGADPRWSPDGTRILFNGGLATGIKSIRVDGTDEKLVIEDPPDKKKTQRWVDYAYWSPGSTHIVYGYRGSPSSVMRATAVGGDRVEVVEGWYYPRWRE